VVGSLGDVFAELAAASVCLGGEVAQVLLPGGVVDLRDPGGEASPTGCRSVVTVMRWRMMEARLRASPRTRLVTATQSTVSGSCPAISACRNTRVRLTVLSSTTSAERCPEVGVQ
jgi:hypothetical protein